MLALNGTPLIHIRGWNHFADNPAAAGDGLLAAAGSLSDHKDGRAGGFARLQIAVRLGRVAQRVGLVDCQLDDPL